MLRVTRCLVDLMIIENSLANLADEFPDLRLDRGAQMVGNFPSQLGPSIEESPPKAWVIHNSWRVVEEECPS